MKKEKIIKDKMIGIKLTGEELEKLQKMREVFDINISSYLRKCLVNKYKELFPEEK